MSANPILGFQVDPADLKNAYIGSLRGTRIPYFQSPVAGLPMVHWSEV